MTRRDAPAPVKQRGTKARAIFEGAGLLQQFGFNGFSFQDIADRLGIKKPSLYEHFRSKEELGNSLIDDYCEQFREWCTTVASVDPIERVGALFELFGTFATDHQKICPLSALLADYNAVPESMRASAQRAFETQKGWLVEVIRDGQKARLFRNDLTSEALAQLVLALGLGVQLTARASPRTDLIRTVKQAALQTLRFNTT